MSSTLMLWFVFSLFILASICQPIQQKHLSLSFQKDQNKSINFNLSESVNKSLILKDLSSQKKQIPSNPNTQLNIAVLTKNQDNDEHKQKDSQCVFNLDYVDQGKKRILVSQQQKGNQLSEDEKILKQFNYIAYLKKYKPTQLNAITKQGKSIQDNFVYRMHTFIQNCKQILKHNLQQNSTYLKGLNQFTDLSDFQFTKLYTASLPMRSSQIQLPQQNQETGVVGRNLQAQKSKLSLRYTTHIDWRCKCTQVYDQKLCRSCYAFAVIDSLEISLRIRNNFQQIYLSSQELISCAKAQFKLFGCSGGYPDDAYSYIKDKGIGSAQLYPINQQTLDGTETQCDKNLINSQKYSKSRIFIRGYVQIKRGDCQQLVRVLKTQIVIVSVFISGLRDYVSGTFVPGQKTGQPEHGATLVGFHPKMKYLIKNSWGPKWGMNGYAYVSESSGVCRYSFYPILK